MAEAKPVQPATYRGAMHFYLVLVMKFQYQLVQRQIAPRLNAALHPAGKSAEFSTPGITLWLRCKRPSLALQNDHVIDEFGRNPEMRGGGSVRVSILNKSDNTFA